MNTERPNTFHPDGSYSIENNVTTEKIKPLRAGEPVRVKRSTGEIEDGWIISSVDPLTRVVDVFKKLEGNQRLTKKIPFNKLREFNP